MDSFIKDELDALLDLKKGDPTRLNRIRELCEEHKLIPISDRKYVERLANQYLRSEKKPEEKKPSFQYQSEPTSKVEVKNEKPRKDFKDITVKEIRPFKKTPQTTETKFELKSKNKILIGLAAIVLAIIVIGTVSLSELELPTISQGSEPTGPALTPPYIILQTDQESYQTKDIISISGESNPIINGRIDIAIENPLEDEIWTESIQVKDEGEFSTLVIAAGSGWENSGEYTIRAKHNSLESTSTFEFNS